MPTVKKAIIVVAGYGTRFLPATKTIPKEMLPIVDKPQVQYLVEEAVASGIRDIIFVTGRAKRAIEDHFDDALELETLLRRKRKRTLLRDIRAISRLAHFSYVRQPYPTGHGDALLIAARLICTDEPAAVLFGDDIVVPAKALDSSLRAQRSNPQYVPALKQLLNAYNQYHSAIIGLVRVPREQIPLYGIVKARILPLSKSNRIYQINRFVEKPPISKAPSNLAVIGKYIVTPQFLSELRRAKRLKTRITKGEFLIGDGLNLFLKEHQLYGCELEGVWHDVGSKLGFLKAQVEFGLNHPEVRRDFRRWLKRLARDPSTSSGLRFGSRSKSSRAKS